MKYLIYFIIVFAISALVSCGICKKKLTTQGEQFTSYSYIPLDPLPIFERPGNSCDTTLNIKVEEESYKELLNSLPDQAVRIAIGSFSSKGGITFGPAIVGVENNTYQVILDYINVDVTTIPLYVERVIDGGPSSGKKLYLFSKSVVGEDKDAIVDIDESKMKFKYIVHAAPREESVPMRNEMKGSLISIPVYIGVGLRLTALVKVLKGKVNLSSLGSLSAAVEAGSLSGSLVIQTLGISGNNVNKLLPLPSEINETTVQNAILALASIKATMGDENTELKARVVGIYNPIGGGQEFINGIITNLAREPVTWYRPCK